MRPRRQRRRAPRLFAYVTVALLLALAVPVPVMGARILVQMQRGDVVCAGSFCVMSGPGYISVWW